MNRNIRSFDGITPQLADSCFVDDSALIIGDCHMGEDCSVWPMAVIQRRCECSSNWRTHQYSRFYDDSPNPQTARKIPRVRRCGLAMMSRSAIT